MKITNDIIINVLLLIGFSKQSRNVYSFEEYKVIVIGSGFHYIHIDELGRRDMKKYTFKNAYKMLTEKYKLEIRKGKIDKLLK